MKSVWLVYGYEQYEQSWLISVFASAESAQKEVERLDKETETEEYTEKYYIEERELYP